ncbi:hypothetical protein DXG01_012180, partial [Tephrocybe rancida]
MCETCFGIYDDFMVGRWITNTAHNKASSALLHHLLSLYHVNLLHPGPEDHKVQARRHAIKDRKLARQIKDWFFCHHDLVLHGVPLHPSHAQDLLDHQFLAQQCKALSTFKQRVEADPNSPYLIVDSDIDGLTYNDKKFFQAQNGRLKVKSEPRARSVAISPVDTIVWETTVANTVKHKQE